MQAAAQKTAAAPAAPPKASCCAAATTTRPAARPVHRRRVTSAARARGRHQPPEVRRITSLPPAATSMPFALQLALLLRATLAFVDEPIDSGATSPPPNNTVWTDALTLGVRGRGWPAPQMTSPYTRLPRHAQGILCNNTAPCAAPCTEHACTQRRCAVWGLSQTATGLHVQFTSAATVVYVRFTVRAENGDWLWAFNGHSGVDVYVQSDATGGVWRWATSSGNNPGNTGGSMSASALLQPGASKVFTAVLGTMEPGLRNFTVYLPSRGTLEKVDIGVDPAHKVAPIGPQVSTQKQKSVVVYGTSILHGAASGRAGMVYSSQMERYIHRPVINLGFSGHGLMQQEVGDLLAELNAEIFVLDCEYNMDSDVLEPGNWSGVECLTYNFIKRLRGKSRAPVLLIEGHDETIKWMSNSRGVGQNSTRNGYRSAFNRLISEGVTGVYYLNGSGKLGGPIDSDFQAQSGPIAGCHVSNYAFSAFAHWIGDKVTRILSGAEPTPSPVRMLEIHLNTTPAAGKQGPIRKWTEASQLGLSGLGWKEETQGTALPYARFPPRARSTLNCTDCTYTYNLSACSAGVLVRFATDADEIQLKVARQSLGDGLLSLAGRQDDIMPYNGRFGIDIYAEDDHNSNVWRWFGTSAGAAQHALSAERFAGLRPLPDGSARKYTVFFPTHIAVSSLQIGVPAAASMAAYEPHKGQAPVAIWASSIGQGGVVQNAGMTWISNVGRILDREVLNLGFSGNCRMQPEVAAMLVELKPAVLVIDCLPNMDATLVQQRASALFKQLRVGLGPAVPILVLEGHTYSNAWILPAVRRGQQAKRAAQKAAFDAAAKTDKHLYYLAGDAKLASLGDEAQHDATSGIGVHPTNIAHLHIARYVAAHIKPLLS